MRRALLVGLLLAAALPAPRAAAALPDGRAFELVSPPGKEGGGVAPPGALFGGGLFQAAAAGGAFTYSSATAFGEAVGAPPGSQYLSIRSASGWVTQNVSEPLQSGGYGDEPDGVPYRIFSEDLSRALVLDPRRCEPAQPCPRPYSLRDSASGALAPLPPQAAGTRVLGASPDLGRIVLEGEGGETYEWSGGALTPLNLLPPSAGPGAAFQATSADRRFAFYTEATHLYRYDAVSETAADLTPAGGVVGVLGISADGSTVYYQDATGLWRWRSGASVQVAPGAEAAAASDFPPATGTARVSADGLHLAFLSASPLTGFDNTDADTGEPDTELYLYGPPPAAGSPELICASCDPGERRPEGPAGIPGALANGSTRIYKPRVLAASGNRVFFESPDGLAPKDANSRPDVYEWEAEGEGDCTQAPGCQGLLSGGLGSAATFLDASADGADVYFLTEASLLEADPGSLDVYDARIGGGLPEPGAPFDCLGDLCQLLPSPPEDPSPGTLRPNSGNPALHYYSERRRCRKAKRKAKRHGKARCASHKRHRHGHHHKRGAGR